MYYKNVNNADFKRQKITFCIHSINQRGDVEIKV